MTENSLLEKWSMLWLDEFASFDTTFFLLAWKSQPVKVWRPTTHLPVSLLHEPLLFTPESTRTLLSHFCKCWDKTPKTCIWPASKKTAVPLFYLQAPLWKVSVEISGQIGRTRQASQLSPSASVRVVCLSQTIWEALYVFRNKVKEEKPLLQWAWRKQLI